VLHWLWAGRSWPRVGPSSRLRPLARRARASASRGCRVRGATWRRRCDRDRSTVRCVPRTRVGALASRSGYGWTRRAVSQVPHPASEVTPSHAPGNALNTSAGGR
jgi:hypothetical protein